MVSPVPFPKIQFPPFEKGVSKSLQNMTRAIQELNCRVHELRWYESQLSKPKEYEVFDQNGVTSRIYDSEDLRKLDLSSLSTIDRFSDALAACEKAGAIDREIHQTLKKVKQMYKKIQRWIEDGFDEPLSRNDLVNCPYRSDFVQFALLHRRTRLARSLILCPEERMRALHMALLREDVEMAKALFADVQANDWKICAVKDEDLVHETRGLFAELNLIDMMKMSIENAQDYYECLLFSLCAENLKMVDELFVDFDMFELSEANRHKLIKAICVIGPRKYLGRLIKNKSDSEYLAQLEDHFLREGVAGLEISDHSV